MIKTRITTAIGAGALITAGLIGASPSAGAQTTPSTAPAVDICKGSGPIAHPPTVKPYITSNVRKEPKVDTTTCGQVIEGHYYNSACWVFGQNMPIAGGGSNNRWLLMQGNQGLWGYVPIANLVGNETASHSQCS